MRHRTSVANLVAQSAGLIYALAASIQAPLDFGDGNSSWAVA